MEELVEICTTTDAIVKTNNLNTNDYLTVGQKLVIPKA